MARGAKRTKGGARGTDAAVAAAVLGAAAVATAGKVVHDRRAKRLREDARDLRIRVGEALPDGLRRVARG